MRADLTTSQLHHALKAVAELAELRELEEFPARTAGILRELVPCDHAGYNIIDLDSGAATVVADPAECVFEGGEEALASFAHQSPVIIRALEGVTRAMRLSDFISRRDLHRTDLYQHVYRIVSMEYQLVLQLPPLRLSPGARAHVVGLSLARSSRDFTAADRRLLDLLSPHFAGTLERLHELALLHTVIADGERDTGRWTLLIDAKDGTVAWASQEATHALAVTAGERLPAALRRWVVAQHVQRAMGPGSGDPTADANGHVMVDGARFRARLVPSAYPQLDALHLSLDGPPDIAGLQRLGLTKRQAEVHALALQGHTAQQIADALVISRRTAEKHLEAIYTRLGVANRAQAVAATIAATTNGVSSQPS